VECALETTRNALVVMGSHTAVEHSTPVVSVEAQISANGGMETLPHNPQALQMLWSRSLLSQRVIAQIIADPACGSVS